MPLTSTPTLSELEIKTTEDVTPTPVQFESFLGYDYQGKGSYTVIFEAGAGMAGLTDEGFTNVINAIKLSDLEPIRTFRYSRLGLEGSKDNAWSGKFKSSEFIIDSLHKLLQKANIPGPYILVGHSMGGLLLRHYQAKYPEEIIGIVLVESMHPDQGPRMDAAMKAANLPWPTISPTDQAEAAKYSESERIDWNASFNQWNTVLKDLGDLPLVVITSDKSTGAGPADIAWWDMQDELAALSTRSVHLHTPASHYVTLEDPAIVVKALEELVKMIQAAP